MFSLEVFCLAKLSQYYFTLFRQSYEFKKELVSKFSCEISEYFIGNLNFISILVVFFGIVSSMTGISSGILFLFLLSNMGFNTYVSLLIY